MLIIFERRHCYALKSAGKNRCSVLRVPLSQLHPHPQNPFAVRDDSAMQKLKESVSQNGVLVPAIARPRAEGGYRRKYAREQSEQDFMPVIVPNRPHPSLSACSTVNAGAGVAFGNHEQRTGNPFTLPGAAHEKTAKVES